MQARGPRPRRRTHLGSRGSRAGGSIQHITSGGGRLRLFSHTFKVDQGLHTFSVQRRACSKESIMYFNDVNILPSFHTTKTLAIKDCKGPQGSVAYLRNILRVRVVCQQVGKSKGTLQQELGGAPAGLVAGLSPRSLPHPALPSPPGPKPSRGADGPTRTSCCINPLKAA